MHIIPKIVLGFGIILFLVGIVAVIIGGATLTEIEMDPENEDYSGTLMWEGVTPITYIDEFKWNTIYNVWVETESEVEIEVYNHNDGTQDSENRFISCSDPILDDCWVYNDEYALPGLEYIGEISISDSGKYEVIFTENNGENVEIQIREERVPFEAGLGILSCCSGFFTLFIGVVLAFVIKDKKKSSFVSYSPVENNVIISSNEENDISDSKSETNEKWWEDQQS